MKQKERFFIVSFLLMLALTVWLMPQMSMKAYGADIRVGTIDVQSDWENDETELKPEDYPGFFEYTSFSWMPENDEKCLLIYRLFTLNNTLSCDVRVYNEVGLYSGLREFTKSTLYSEYSDGYKIYYTKGYTVSLTGGENAAVSGGGTSQTVIGDITKVTYTAESGYHFDKFTEITKDGITAEWVNDTTVEVTGTPTDDVNIKIPDATQYKLTVVLSQGGNVTSESTQYPSGVKVELTVTPETGYQLKAGSPTYTEDGSTVRNPVTGPDSEGKYTFTMPAKNVTVYAEFEAIDYNIADPWKINVDIHNYTNTGAKGIPGDVPAMEFSLTISIIDKENRTEVSKADNVKVNIIGGPNTAKISLKDVEFDRKVEDLSEAKYQIVVSGIPSEVVSPAPLLQVYKLSYKAWPGGKELVTIYLKWDDGKTSEEPEKIKIYALPEDEIGAYTIDENGVKVYLLFHTKKICEQWLGPGAHCENYERCFHKESPYENPFVTTTGVIGEIVVVGN